MQSVFVLKERKIVACCYCKVKKYNFDLVEPPAGAGQEAGKLFCSLNCLSLQRGRPSIPATPAVKPPAPSLSPARAIPVQTQTVRGVDIYPHPGPCIFDRAWPGH